MNRVLASIRSFFSRPEAGQPTAPDPVPEQAQVPEPEQPATDSDAQRQSGRESAQASRSQGSRKQGTLYKLNKRLFNLKVCRKKKDVEALKLETARRNAEAREVAIEISSVVHKKADLICPICLKFICTATCCACGHAFCTVCIQEYFLLASDCLVCGQKIRGKRNTTLCKNLDNLVEKLLDTLDNAEELEDFKLRKAEAKSYILEKRPQNMEVGQKVDVRSFEYVWCVGVIKKILYKQETRSKVLSIHYEGFPTEFNESISENSSRLARYRFYTGRKGTPRSSDIPTLRWTDAGERLIMLRGRKIPYNFLGSSVPKDPANQLIDTDDEK